MVYDIGVVENLVASKICREDERMMYSVFKMACAPREEHLLAHQGPRTVSNSVSDH